jgi:low affinity Fe/Cu permease
MGSYDRFARTAARWLGSVWASSAAMLSVIVWLALGPFYDWSDTWQLIANTGTTVITYLMVFIIQNTQNRDTAELKAMQRQEIEDLPEVDEKRALERVEEEAKR